MENSPMSARAKITAGAIAGGAAVVLFVGRIVFFWAFPVQAPLSHHQVVVNAAEAACSKWVHDNGKDYYSTDLDSIRKKPDDGIGEAYSFTCNWFDGQDVN